MAVLVVELVLMTMICSHSRRPCCANSVSIFTVACSYGVKYEMLNIPGGVSVHSDRGPLSMPDL